MAKKSYEDVTVRMIFCENLDIVTASGVVFDDDGENYGSVNKSWYGGTD